MNIIIFTNAGATFSFDNCTKISITSNGIKFNYFGNATRVYRDAEFKWTSVAGYAVHDDSVMAETDKN